MAVQAEVEALAPPEEETRQRSLWVDAGQRLIRNRLAMVSAVVIGLMAIVAIFAPLIAPHPAREQLYFKEGSEICEQYSPSSKHWFGIDRDCRDVFSRLVYGSRISLTIGIFTQFVVVTIGVLVGGIAGLGGPRWDNIMMRITDITYGFPDLLLIILFSAAFSNTWLGRYAGGVFLIFLAIGVAAWVTIARLIRGQILSRKERDFVTAARALGASQMQILWKHLLPNTLGPVIVAITFGIPAAIFSEAALSFIGVGIKPPTASWGIMVSEGYQVILVSFWPVLIPAIAIAVTMLSFTFLGDGLRDALDPRTRGSV
jgi:oligopeptide transport system permease protein